MIIAAKQDMWEARREPRGHVFCGERRGKQCDLTIDQLRTWKGLVRVRFECKETAAAVLAWAKENGIVLVDDRGAALRREAAVPPSPVVPLARPVPASPRQQPKPDQHFIAQNAIAAAPTAERMTVFRFPCRLIDRRAS
jgi:predicted component of type VI protein secretion system